MWVKVGFASYVKIIERPFATSITARSYFLCFAKLTVGPLKSSSLCSCIQITVLRLLDLWPIMRKMVAHQRVQIEVPGCHFLGISLLAAQTISREGVNTRTRQREYTESNDVVVWLEFEQSPGREQEVSPKGEISDMQRRDMHIGCSQIDKRGSDLLASPNGFRCLYEHNAIVIQSSHRTDITLCIQTDTRASISALVIRASLDGPR
jgi:hypothetical protein